MERKRKHSFVLVGLIAALVLLGFDFFPGSMIVLSQTRIRQPRASVPSVAAEGRISRQTFGTASQVSHTVQAFAFAPQTTGVDIVDANLFGSRFCTGPCLLGAPLFLPSGALVSEIELEACDLDAVNQVTATLVVVGNNEASATEVAVAATGIAPIPGCNVFSSLLAPPIEIDNLFNSYFIEVANGGGITDAVRFQAVRVFYNLQISPPPALATFFDVPATHPFFRFVEALAASGITGGCSPGFYCPDFPVTRGQMAVFLSTALGLHWPD